MKRPGYAPGLFIFHHDSDIESTRPVVELCPPRRRQRIDEAARVCDEHRDVHSLRRKLVGPMHVHVDGAGLRTVRAASAVDAGFDERHRIRCHDAFRDWVTLPSPTWPYLVARAASSACDIPCALRAASNR